MGKRGPTKLYPERVSLHLPGDLYDWLTAKAKAEAKPINAIIRRGLASYQDASDWADKVVEEIRAKHARGEE